MWTPATRRRHSREHLRYASDVSDEEWALLEPHLPAPCLTGRPRAWPMREIVNAIFYVLRSGCAWRLLPDSFPPRQTVYGWFLRLRDDCVLERLNHHLVMLDRARSGRAASPSAGVIKQPESVKITCRAGGPRGYDAGKKIKGRKRHILTHTNGCLLVRQRRALKPTSRTAMGPCLGCWPRCAVPPRPRAMSSPMAAMPGTKPDTWALLPMVAGPEIVLKPTFYIAKAFQLLPQGGWSRTSSPWNDPQPPPCQGLRGIARNRPSLPLRRLHHAAHPTARAIRMSFEVETVQQCRGLSFGVSSRTFEDPRVALATLGYTDLLNDRAVPFYGRRRNPFVRTEKWPRCLRGAADGSVFEPSSQAQVRFPEQPPAPDIHDNCPGAGIHYSGGGSLIDVLGGHSNSGVARTKGFDLHERCPQFPQRSLASVTLLDPHDGLRNQS